MKSYPIFGLVLISSISLTFAESGAGWVSYPGGKGPGAGKHIVLLSGDEEYRSEESMPMMGKILSERHGFKCTVLFSIDPDGTINPNRGESLGKPEALDSADLVIMALRFRKWPDETMKHFDEAINRGTPLVALRTSTHPFQLPATSGYVKYNQFGEDVIGEEWVSHWGVHKVEATLAVIEPGSEENPILNGVKEIFGDSDVYEAVPPGDSIILMRGRVLKGMIPTDEPATHEKKRKTGELQGVNSPMMPVVWTRAAKNFSGSKTKLLCTTMGAATDLESEDLRRLVVNGVFWGLALPVPEKADVEVVGNYKPSKYSFDAFLRGVKPSDHELPGMNRGHR